MENESGQREYDASPFCRHWPADCDRPGPCAYPCACGHECCRHGYGACDVEECDCKRFRDPITGGAMDLLVYSYQSPVVDGMVAVCPENLKWPGDMPILLKPGQTLTFTVEAAEGGTVTVTARAE